MGSMLSRVYVRGPDADHLNIVVRFYWHDRRHKWIWRFDGYYKALCRLGLHLLHDSFARDMLVCSCDRNFIHGEDIVP